MRAATVFLILAVVAILSCGVAFAEEDFYDVLGLEKKDESTEREIKSSWRKLSKKFHPDLHGESTREQYVKIQRAYEVLSDRKKRKIYDMKGDEGLKQLEEQQRAGNDGRQQQMDPFMRMFGMGGGGGQATRGKDVEMMLLVTLEDIYSGAAHSVKLSKQKLCRHCKGSGADSKDAMMKCKKCDGKGVVVQRIQIAPGFVQQAQQPCPKCNGKGTVVKKKCHVCKGQKVMKVQQVLDIDIERGTPENHRLVYEMEADQSPDLLPGDVIFTVVTDPHPVFTRKGNDLLMTIKISLKEALLGFAKTYKHLDGHEFDVEQSGVIQYGQQLTISEEGMPVHNVPSERGNLIVTFEVELPRFLTNEQQEGIRANFPR